MTAAPGPRALEAASRLGARAGRRFVTTGIPSPNPLNRSTDLAAAWRRGYLAALARPRS